MRQVKLVWILIAFISAVYGAEDSKKHSLKCNMLHLYDEVPGEVESIGDMFSQGMFYGRSHLNPSVTTIPGAVPSAFRLSSIFISVEVIVLKPSTT